MKKFFIFLLLMLILLTTKTNTYCLQDIFVETNNFCCAEMVGLDTYFKESVALKNYEPLKVVETLKGEIEDVQILQNGVQILNVYSPLFNKQTFANKKFVNLQVCCFDKYLIVGVL